MMTTRVFVAEAEEAEWRREAMGDARDALACGDYEAAWVALNRHENPKVVDNA